MLYVSSKLEIYNKFFTEIFCPCCLYVKGSKREEEI